MTSGPSSVWPRAGSTARRSVGTSSKRPCWSPTQSFPRPRSNTTAIWRWRRSRLSWRWDTPAYHHNPHLIDETFGILARTYKDLGFQYRETNPARAHKYWKRSFRHYNSAYAKTGSYYTGINAATLSLLLGAPGKARALAERVLGD